MHSVRFGGLAVLTLMLLGCGSDPGDNLRADATSSSTSTVPPATTVTTVPAGEPGPATLIAATPDKLIALDLETGDVTVLAKYLDLAASLEVSSGRVEGVDLSPDGSTVTFAFNGSDNSVGEETRDVGGLFEVSTDGSTPARRVALDTGDAPVSNPRYSPDGRFLSVYSGDRLMVLDGERVSTDGGVQMPYPPRSTTWSPSGEALVIVPHFERSACCPIASLRIDPTTGEVSESEGGDRVDGLPYFDSTGELRTVPDDVYSFDVDASGSFVIASDTDSQGLVWWDTATADEPHRQPLPLDISLQDRPMAFAW